MLSLFHVFSICGLGDKMSNTLSESKSINDKLTVYDAFHMMKESVTASGLRHIIEGAVIVASPSILKYTNPIQRFGDVHDSRYKLKVAQTVRDTLIKYSHDNLLIPESEIDVLSNIPILTDYPGYGKRGLNLPFVVLQMTTNLNEEQKRLAYIGIGEITEKALKSFYTNRGYRLHSKDRPESVASYLIAEYEFFTRIAAEVSNRTRKL
jgi:hypothetical protein